MLSNVMLIVGNVLTLLLIVLAGLFLGKRGYFAETTQNQMARLLNTVITPCLILSSMPERSGGDTLRVFLQTFFIMLLILAGCAVAAQALFRDQPEDLRVTLRYGVIYGNIGYLGVPLLQSAFGEAAMLYAAIGGAAFNLMVWTQGISLMDRGGRRLSRKAVLNPGTLCFLLGMALMLLGKRLPAPVDRGVSLLAAMNTPLAMLVVGAQMATADIRAIFMEKKYYLVSFVRLVAAPAVVMTALLPLKLEEMLYLSLVILSACPVATLTSTFSQMYGRDARAGAQVVIQSTVLSLLTMPAVTLMAQLLYRAVC